MKTVYVDCYRDGALIASYDFGIPASVSSPPIYDGQELIVEAKTNLSNQGLAGPPFAGVTFKVREV